MEFSNYLLDTYEKYFYAKSEIKVASNFKGQMRQINCLLKNDKTGLISTLIDFMVNTGNVDIDFQTSDIKLNNILNDWKKTVNKNLNIDIPMGLRSFTTQYLRERFTSSFLVIRIVWETIDGGYILPTKMWVMDGASIIAKNETNALNRIKYYFGKDEEVNLLKDSTFETVIVRKPYNQWYDIYPTPYIVKRGALYHGLFKQELLSRQGELITSSFPYQLIIKMGTEAALRKGLAPTDADLKAQLEMFKDLKSKYDTHQHSKGLAGAYPFDVNFEEMIPDYEKGLKEALTKAVDKNILSSMGMIELRGFSSNREEAMLNPKIMVEEINDTVLDYVELLSYVVELIKEKNSGSYKFNKEVNVVPGLIKAFITDEMKTLIRSWYDRGVVSYQDGLENTTGLNFEQQVIKRDKERKLNLNEKMYPRIVQNLEKDVSDKTQDDDISDDKKQGTPEVNNYKNAILKSENDIPFDIAKELNSEEKQIFIEAYNKKFKECEVLDYDEDLKINTALQYACDLIIAIHTKVSQLPDSVKNNMTTDLQQVFMDVVNKALKSGDSEEAAFKQAWSVISNIAVKDKNGYWKKKKEN